MPDITKLPLINYITNLDVNEYSGGWSGMNRNVYLQLKKRFEINLIQNINPSYLKTEKILSRICRVIGLRGSFPAFTARRLNRIGTLVRQQLSPSATLNFFHGSTPWLEVNSVVPYAVYLDTCFATYMEVYQNSQQFNAAQLMSLYRKEKLFLENAVAVFFSSEWAMNEAKKQYQLTSENFKTVRLGADEKNNPTEALTKEEGIYFLFIALDFIGKGGITAVKALQHVRSKFPSTTLKVIGQKPPEDIMKLPGIEYVGFLKKTVPEENKRLYNYIKKSYCLLLPTSKDMTPLVVIEAASMACPVIATESFGLPEMITNGETGILISPEPQNMVENLARAMSFLLSDVQFRNNMGEKAKAYILKNYDWDSVGEAIYNTLSRRLVA